ncbi:hypothetical protein [Euzebya sp.]|uniref:hypothetical protein n=1 Tax=Euzebya sp. TaxID=1971409 RepID=UPI003516C77C
MSTSRLGAVALVGCVLLAGCGVLGIRADVSIEEARELLDQAVGLTADGDPAGICGLSPSEASTCLDTLETAGALVPEDPPRIDCVVRAPEDGPLRGGVVLVLSGTDRNGDGYTTEFVVFDDGEEIGALDAVWWSGLSIKSYDGDTVTWRFDSSSETCDRGGLPTGAPVPGTGSEPGVESESPSE